MPTPLEEFLAKNGVLSHATQDGGNTQAVIVALPSAMDSIRLVGDEDKHATLLYFGETATLSSDVKDAILNTLEQASNLFSPFSERIDTVSRLGSEVPPALVAMLSNRNLGQIRNVLRINPTIDAALSNGTQYPNYTPHVTLAYPDYQGEAELRNIISQVYRISFDRLALWWNDEHYEFTLGTDVSMDDVSESLSMSDIDLENYLAHFGVKGMKWGIRRSRSELEGTHAGRPKGTGLHQMKSGSVITKEHADGSHTTLIKGKDGKWTETHLSADAEKFMKSHMKAPHEMSDVELRETLNRARMVEDYNKIFSPQKDNELKAKVENLDLEKRYSKLHAELNPSKIAKATALVASASSAYVAYQKLNKASGGTLGMTISSSLGQGAPGKHRGVAKSIVGKAKKP